MALLPLKPKIAEEALLIAVRDLTRELRRMRRKMRELPDPDADEWFQPEDEEDYD